MHHISEAQKIPFHLLQGKEQLVNVVSIYSLHVTMESAPPGLTAAHHLHFNEAAVTGSGGLRPGSQRWTPCH